MEYVGITLLKHYNSYELAKSLVNYSPSCSSLKENLEVMEQEEVAHKDDFTHYMFDSEYDIIEEVENGKYFGIEFFYLFDNGWQVAIPKRIPNSITFGAFVNLEKLCKDNNIL